MCIASIKEAGLDYEEGLNHIYFQLNKRITYLREQMYSRMFLFGISKYSPPVLV